LFDLLFLEADLSFQLILHWDYAILGFPIQAQGQVVSQEDHAEAEKTVWSEN
jgi:hypothetical protein